MHQPNLFSPEPDRAHPAPPSPAPNSKQQSAWLRCTELLVRVIVRLYLGLLITALPWMRFWTDNGLFSYLPGTSLLAGSGFLRGLVSGLGLLNIAIAFRELLLPKQTR